MKVNAGALPDDLLEAELFGAEAGAFTGANKPRIGRFEAAHGGTLFLDEIGNLSLAGQAKLLRVLQTGEFERLGSSGTRKVDVRVVSATNADLPRRDRRRPLPRGPLLPPQRDRAAAAAAGRAPRGRAAAGRALPRASSPGIDGAPPAKLSDEARAALQQYDWPGNVRELQNRIQRATLTAADGVIRPRHLGIPAGARAAARAESRAAAPTPSGGSPTLAAQRAETPDGAAAGDPERARDRRGAAQGQRRGVEGGRRDGPVAPGALPPHGAARDRARTPSEGLT